jgi:hypothetical protein
MLDCSVGNSKSQLHKAKMKMRDLLFPKRRILRRAVGNHIPESPVEFGGDMEYSPAA